MRKNEVFPSRWLQHDDINGTHMDLTINKVGWAEFNDGTKKRAVWFDGTDKGLALNVTNWDAIADQTGLADDDRWVGVKVRLVNARVPFQGKTVNAIRVRFAKAPATAAKAPEPEPEPDFDAAPDFGNDGTDCPF
jgi:hypothetical protein